MLTLKCIEVGGRHRLRYLEGDSIPTPEKSFIKNTHRGVLNDTRGPLRGVSFLCFYFLVFRTFMFCIICKIIKFYFSSFGQNSARGSHLMKVSSGFLKLRKFNALNKTLDGIFRVFSIFRKISRKFLRISERKFKKERTPIALKNLFYKWTYL